jgi:6-phosphogluconolactonase (cycloisomerase 2 family)
MKTPRGILIRTIGLQVLAAGLQAQQFVYTNNDVSTANTVSAFSDTNGVLTEIPNSPFATGGRGIDGGAYAVNRIAVAGGKFLYASNGGSGDVAGFVVDPNAGSLAPVPNSPFATGSAWSGDISLAASPDGQFLFAGVAASNTIIRFAINPDGSLTQVATAAVPVSPTGMKVSPKGNFLAVGLPGYLNTGGVAMFNIANGALTMVNGTPFPDAGSGNLTGVDIDCAGSHLFGAEMTSGNPIVDAFGVGASATLSSIQGSPFVAGVGKNSNVATLSPNDQFLFVTNQGSRSITIFNVNSTGGLAFANSTALLTPSLLAGMATNQAGTVLYVASNPNSIYVFNIAADGSLMQAAGSPFSTNQPTGLLSIAAFPGKVCAAGPAGGPPPNPNPPPPVTPPPSSGPTTVNIQIRTRDDNDEHAAPVNLKSHGNIRVAILSTAKFNAPSLVDLTSLTFGHSGSEKSLAYCEPQRQDANHDRILDLVCRFETGAANFQKRDTTGILKGMLLDGTPIIGSDSIRVED